MGTSTVGGWVSPECAAPRALTGWRGVHGQTPMHLEAVFKCCQVHVLGKVHSRHHLNSCSASPPLLVPELLWKQGRSCD